MRSIITPLSVVVSLVASSSAPFASAGTIVASGNTSLWGSSRAYTSWDVLFDPLDGIVEPAEGRVRDFAFHNGRLYCGANTRLGDGGPWYYEPGASGNLSTPIQPTLPGFAPGDPRRWITHSVLAINGSGAGYGAFSGPDPTLVGVGVNAGNNGAYGFSLAHTGSQYAAGPVYDFFTLDGFPPMSLEYVPGLDRFVSVASSAANPAVSVFNFSPHTADGILMPDASFTLNVSGVRGISPVSAAFASNLTGQSIASDALLVLQKDLLGLSDPPRLMVVSYEGQILSQSSYVIPGWQDPWALGVDETNGLLFTSDRELGVITVVQIPAPGSVMLLGGAICTFARRRR